VINRKRFSLLFLAIAFAIPLTFFLIHFHILLPNRNISISDDSAHLYSIDNKRSLLVWKNEVFLVYHDNQWVGRPSDYRNKLLGRIFWPKDSSIVFWPRGSYSSVLLGDRVKEDPRNAFQFEGDEINIRCYFGTADSPYEITIKL
jgi:hypothetical protein